jgi:ABC-type antimicrobial peptide transport system permease subunit
VVRFPAGFGQDTGFGTPVPINGQLTLIGVPPHYSSVIPAIATRSFLSTSGATVGGVVRATLDGLPVNVRIVGAVSTFPTVSNPAGALIVNVEAMDNVFTVNATAPPSAGQWWLATAGQRVPPGLAASLPAGSSVVSETALASSLLNNPLSDVPQQAILGVAVAALLLACTGFCVSIAAGARQRRAENALLAALGVTPRAAAIQLSLEKLMLSLPAAVAGLLLGLVLADLLVPAITLTAAGTAPVPPVLVTFGWTPSLGTALVLAVLPVLAAALIMVRRPDPAAGLRTAESA